LLEMADLPTREGLDGQSLLALVADPDSDWRKAVVATVGRGTHSVFTRRWRYIHYFDGSEELYDLRDDPREWFNLANDAAFAEVKQRLATHIPEDKRYRQFVRWGRWKCVIPVRGEPMLFDYRGEFGVSEQNDVALEHPDVIAAIQTYLQKNQISKRFVNMPTATGDE